jgi:predicted O-linked N-acetylglucosamine transferase (SPINDLY family)
VQFTDPQAALNHAMDLHRQGRLAEAEELYRQLHAKFPTTADLTHLLGLVTMELGRHAAGEALLVEAIRQNPNVAHYHANFGTKLIDRRETARAIALLERSVQLAPDAAQHYYNLGNAYVQGQRYADAIHAYQQALVRNPGYAIAELQLGMALHLGGSTDAGIAFYRQALERRPTDFAIATNLGALLQAVCDIDGAIAAFKQSLAIDARNFFALNNLGIMLKERGEITEAIELLRRCLELNPDSPEVRSNIILTMHYDPAVSDAELAEQHREWDRRHGSPASGRIKDHPNSMDPHRRLRIGYVSADLRDHVVGRALLPAFRHHDHSAFEITCYSMCQAQTATDAFKSCSDRWRDMAGTSDAEFARQVQADEIDILIDLSLHTSDNRLTAFALKPAPIQVTWLGCPESSGLSVMDYRISDRHLEPSASNVLAAAHEKACLLPDSWTCYEAPAGYPDVNGLPAKRNGYLTFGSFNNSCKISAEVLATWGSILRAVPNSRLMLLAKQGGHRRRMTEVMESHGITADRLVFADYHPATDNLDQGRLLSRYHQVDIALDTFPYNGMTTTLDALWMGVPVVSLVGRRSLGRAGLSLLKTVGLPRFAVESIDAYVDLATKTAQDLDDLAALRAGLRPKMQASALIDAPAFTHKLEAGLRDMWVEWCKRQGTVG